MTILEYVAAASAIIGLLWGVVKIVVGLTPSKKDDEIIEKIDPVVTTTTEALSKKKGSAP